MPDAAELARLRTAFPGNTRSPCGGTLWAWRSDGTTPVVRAPDLAVLRAGIRETGGSGSGSGRRDPGT